MKRVNFFLKYRIYLLLHAGLLIALSYKFSNLTSISKELEHGASLLSQRIVTVTKQIDQEFTPEYFAKNFGQKKLTKEEVERLNNLPYVVLTYRNDSLSFWSNNSVIPSPGSSFVNGTGFQKFKNGYYLTFTKSFSNKPGKTLTLVTLIPLKYDYITTNNYLRNHFSDQFKLPDYFYVSAYQKSNYVPVILQKGETLFYLGLDESERSTQPGLWALFFFFFGILTLLFFLNHLINLLPVQSNTWLRPVILTGVYTCVLIFFSNKSWLPDGVENWRIFNPVLFASSGVATSLGSLFIQLIFLVWICVHLSNKFRLRVRFSASSFYNYMLHLGGYLAIFIMVLYCVVVIQSLVRDSKIEFAFLNPLEPDYFSILGVLCIALLLFCLFLLSEKIISFLQQRPLKWFDNVMALLICTLLAFAYYISYNISVPGFWIMGWINVYILLLPYFSIGTVSRLNFTRLFSVLVFFALAGAAMLFYYGEQKEKDTRLVYAKKLIRDRDVVTEYLLLGLRERIESDAFIAQFFKTPQLTGKEVADRLQQYYFQEGFNRYAIRLYAFSKNGVLLPGWEGGLGHITEEVLTSLMKPVGKDSDQLYYSSSPSGNIAYLVKYNVHDADTLVGRLFVELKTNAYKSASVYPELLLSDKDKPPVVMPAYSYAIYNNHQMIAHQGTYNYEYHLRWDMQPGMESQFIAVNQANHLIYRPPNNNIVIVVSKSNNSGVYFLSYFSFLFVVIFVSAMGIVLVNILIYHPEVHSLREIFRVASLRTLIQSFFMIFVLLMLFVTGYVTGRFFLKQFNDLSKTTVTDKMNRIALSVQYLLDNKDSDTAESYSIPILLRKNISQFADVQDNEVNFYDRTGDLIASSQPSIFEKGIIARKINPVAFFELKKETQIAPVNVERIGKLEFYSGYQVISDERGRPLCFVNVPYYNSRQKLNEQVGFFFVTLVNILVLATIIAGLMAPFISRQITAKLSVISDKFKRLRVGQTNELIEWHANDEIGSLVTEYNKMIKELEKSTEKLSRSQRELAWREMAKQVAHEIKNPLTPMKLSIQHLQRAYESNAPNLQELVSRVSKTLIEQIDNLSGIATEFSNFAKMPKPEIELVQVNDILKSSAELHKEYAHANIHLHCNAERSMVEADRNQLLSVFNNLLLNAVQSISEEKTGEINIITENEDGQLIVSVSDNGIGISDEEVERVFVPNFTTKSSGTGLGLAICKNIIDSLGGSISFTSQKDVGTTFYVHLPLSLKNNLS